MSPSRVVYLGPEYTFSHDAAAKLYPNAELFYRSSFPEIFQLVRDGEMDYGVLPVENSSTGMISEAYQLLLEQNYEPLDNDIKVQIVNELYLPVSQHLLARNHMNLAEIKTLYTHRQPQLQCSEYISSKLAGIRIENTVSTADAAQQLLQDSSGACLGGDLLAKERNLVTLAPNIQDVYRNLTRFFGISAKHRSREAKTKTTFAIVIPDKAGSLVEVLKLIASEQINLKTIKTLPVRDSKFFRQDFKDWFVIDVLTSQESPQFQNFDSQQKDRADVILGFKLLGSYHAYDRQEHIKQPQRIQEEELDIASKALLGLIARGESEKVEFKSTLRYDLKEKRVNKELGRVIGKTLSAFMNSSGGTLFIGVGDNKEPIGIELDIAQLQKADEDGFLGALYQIVIDLVGKEFCQLIHPTFLNYEQRRICAIEVDSGSKPAWLSVGDNQSFYIRAGNSSRELKAREALEYILTQRFKST